MRAVPGLDWGPQMRSLPGAAFVLSPGLLSLCLSDGARRACEPVGQGDRGGPHAGMRRRQALWRVALPLLRPALAAGVALAVMETLADYGAVQFLSVQTLTTGVVRSWFVYGSLAARHGWPCRCSPRRRCCCGSSGSVAGRDARSGQGPLAADRRQPLAGVRRWLAFGFCLSLLTAGLLLPVGWLIWNRADDTRTGSGSSRPPPQPGPRDRWSLAHGRSGDLLALGAADADHGADQQSRLCHARRGHGDRPARAGLAALEPRAGSGTGVGSCCCCYAYAARLMAAALEPIEAGLTRVTPSMSPRRVPWGAARQARRSPSICRSRAAPC